MVLMMIVMRALEASGAPDKIVAILTPVVRPFGRQGGGAQGRSFGGGRRSADPVRDDEPECKAGRLLRTRRNW
jgi:hypothetical protein